MSEFFFVVKTLIVTVVVVLLMQMRVGTATLEQHSLAWLRQSSIVHTLRDVAEGAKVLLLKGYDSANSLIGDKIPKVKFESSEKKRSNTESRWIERRAKAEEESSREEGPMGEEID